MSIEKIEEMAKDIACKIAWDEDEIPTVNCLETAKRLYNAGYRKSSEVAREIFGEIENDLALMGICFNDETILYELKKKYTEGNNDSTHQ